MHFQVSSSLLVCQMHLFCLVKFFYVFPLLFDEHGVRIVTPFSLIIALPCVWHCFFFCERCVWHCFMQSLMFFDSFHLSWFVLYFRFCRYNLIDIGSGFLWFFTFICLTLLVGAPNFSTVLGMLHSGGYIKDHNGPSNWHYLGHGPLLLAHTLLGIHGTAMEQWCTVPDILYCIVSQVASILMPKLRVLFWGLGSSMMILLLFQFNEQLLPSWKLLSQMHAASVFFSNIMVCER